MGSAAEDAIARSEQRKNSLSREEKLHSELFSNPKIAYEYYQNSEEMREILHEMASDDKFLLLQGKHIVMGRVMEMYI